MRSKPVLFAVLALAQAGAAASQDAPPQAALARMPVREITVFKDGHVFALHEGAMPTLAGNVVLDYLPAPVLGTFWPYSGDKAVTLRTVVASQRRVSVEKTALTVAEFLRANTGAEVIVTERSAHEAESSRRSGTLLGFPSRSSRELETTSPPNAPEALPVKGAVVLLKTSEGVRVINVEDIKDVTFKNAHKPTVADEEFRNVLTLRLDWAGRTPQKSATVGLVYLQKGIRWIPSYRVAIDGKGKAVVRLQAMLINEMTDLEDVTANLVIGVPQFAFKDTLDPIALQRQANQLSQYFQQGGRGYQLSNAIGTQIARMAEAVTVEAEPASDLGPTVTDSGRTEDLFVFTVKNLSLKKGERMALPVAEYSVPYKDVFTLDVPLAPPAEVRPNVGGEQQVELARLLASPKVTHKIRLSNDGAHPFTTAPALIVRDERLLAQGMLTYTPVGAKVDLEITKAVDIQVAKSETETQRTPKALRWQNDDFGRIDLEGSLALTNRRGVAVQVEVVRYVVGFVDAAGTGQTTKVNVFEDSGYLPSNEYLSWWGFHNWPFWWRQVNGISRIAWDVKLEPGTKVELPYKWHYFWR